MSGSFLTDALLNYLINLEIFLARIFTANQRAIFDRIEDLFPEFDELLEDIGIEFEDILREVLGDADGVIGQIIGGVVPGINGLVGNAGRAIEGIGDAVGGGIGDILDSLGDAIEDLIEKISDALENVVNTIGDTLNNLARGILERIDEIVENAINLFNRAIERTAEFFQNLFRNASELLENIADTVVSRVTEFVESAKEALTEAFNNVTEFVGNQIERAAEFIREATDKIAEIGATIVQNAEEILNGVSEQVNRAIEALTDTASGALSAVREGLDNLQSAVTSALEGLGPVLQEFVVAPTTEATLNLLEAITGKIDQAVITPTEDMTRIFACMGLPGEAGVRAREVIDCIFPGKLAFGPILQNLLVIFGNLMIATSWAQQLGQAAGIKAMQEIQPAFPIALPDPAMVQEMLRLRAVDDATARTLLIKNGFAPENADRILEIRRRLPDVGMIQVWFLRNFITRDQAADLLQMNGFTSQDAQRTIDMSFFIPPVADLITMAVREVFSPAVAERFGQFEDFPEDFAEHARQQGISDEWARRYWAAHWSLPSVQMGFEMLHRRVINQDELNLLLRSQDVMPFWRDKLTAISFRPLTRVDIRRMHKLGVLSNEQVKDAYKDIGYDDTNAERLLQFTIELNKPDDGDTPEQLEGLTRAAIISLFRRGTITRSEAGELLRAIGLGAAAAETFLQVAELQSDEEERDAETNLIIEQARAGIITRAQAEDRLNALGMTAVETDRALLKLARTLDAQATLPSKSDLDRMVKVGIINDLQYLDTMTRLGFSATWAVRLLQLAKLGGES